MEALYILSVTIAIVAMPLAVVAIPLWRYADGLKSEVTDRRSRLVEKYNRYRSKYEHFCIRYQQCDYSAADKNIAEMYAELANDTLAELASYGVKKERLEPPKARAKTYDDYVQL